MRKIIYTLFLLTSGLILIAQTGNQNQNNINNITPPSPEASQLGKYVEIPVGYYTGTPEISIPVCEVKQGDLSVPVSLSYHASGIRVEEFAGWTGIGWTLNAGGAVTRVIRGLPDDKNDQQSFQNLAGQYTYEYLIGGAAQGFDSRGEVLRSIYDGCSDAEPDLFMFNFNGYTGKMMFNWNGGLTISSTKPIKVQDIRGMDVYPNRIIGWDITTEDGSVYKFRDVEKSYVRFNTGLGCRNEARANSTWFLTDIFDVNNENWIHFEYEDYTQTLFYKTSTTIKHDHTNAAGILQGNTSINTYDGKRVKKITTSSGASTVDFVPGVIRSDLSDLYNPTSLSDNDNLRSLNKIVIKDGIGNEQEGFTFGYDYSTGRLTLKTITEIFNNQSKPPHDFYYEAGSLPSINSISQDHWGFYNAKGNVNLVPGIFYNDFYYAGGDRSVNTSSTKIGTLNSIKYPTGGKVEFEYEQNEYSFIQGTPLENLCRYNTIPVNNNIASGSNYDPNSTGIKSVTFTITPYPCNPPSPEHGLVQFEYEGFNYDMPTLGSKPWVKLLAPDGTELYFHRFNANEGSNTTPETGSFYEKLLPGTYTIQAFGTLNTTNPSNLPPNYAFISASFITHTTLKLKDLSGGLRIKKITERESDNDIKPRIRQYNYNPSGDLSRSTGVIYQEPRYEYSGYEFDYPNGVPLGACEQGVGEYSYVLRMSQNVTSLGTTQGSHIGYQEVSVTYGNNPYNGKSVFKYTSPVEHGDDISQELPFQPATSVSYATGLLKEQTDYVYDGTTTRIARNVLNEYYTKEFLIPGLKIASKTKLECAIGSCCMQYFIYGTYGNILGHTQLKKTTNKIYDSQGFNTTLITVQDFEYDTELQNLKKQTQTQSDGNKTVTELYYSKDYTNQTTLITELKNKNIVGIPLESVTKKVYSPSDERIISGTYNELSIINNKIRLSGKFGLKTRSPILSGGFVYSFNNGNLDSRYVKDFNINYNPSSGNISEQTKTNDITKSYLWDYHNSYLIAEATNTNNNNIAYTSFESDGSGNWTISTALRDASSALTGKKSYNLSNGQISKSNLDISKTYIASYWSKNGAQNINGTPAISGRIFGAWTYYEHRIVNPEPGTITVSGSGVIDELRLYPEKSLMTTYSYEPLIGITSQCDANNRLSYYEYDALNRLSLIRDQDNNIIKKICYNYAGQVENCTGNSAQTFSNVVKTGVFTRNNCSAGYTGSSVTYTVPAAAYTSTISQADADAQAQSDINANGQTYANTNGICTIPTIYAKLEYTNWYYDVTVTTATVLIKFYSDASGTIPVSVSNLSVGYQRTKTFCNENQTVTTPTVTCNGTQYSLGTQTIVSDNGVTTQCYTQEFILLAGSGYTIIY